VDFPFLNYIIFNKIMALIEYVGATILTIILWVYLNWEELKNSIFFAEISRRIN